MKNKDQVAKEVEAVLVKFDEEAQMIEQDMRAFAAPYECRDDAYEGFEERFTDALLALKLKHDAEEEEFENMVAQLMHDDYWEVSYES